uniref:Uncharacterized protein n=1 Tax=Arundo donax TaxID=35708 RepID=A0A0A9B8K9_ARUDO
MRSTGRRMFAAED